jgi:hypothetical protein
MHPATSEASFREFLFRSFSGVKPQGKDEIDLLNWAVSYLQVRGDPEMGDQRLALLPLDKKDVEYIVDYFPSGSPVLWQSIKRNLHGKFGDRKMMVRNQGKHGQDNKMSRANFTNPRMPMLSAKRLRPPHHSRALEDPHSRSPERATFRKYQRRI